MTLERCRANSSRNGWICSRWSFTRRSIRRSKRRGPMRPSTASPKSAAEKYSPSLASRSWPNCANALAGEALCLPSGSTRRGARRPGHLRREKPRTWRSLRAAVAAIPGVALRVLVAGFAADAELLTQLGHRETVALCSMTNRIISSIGITLFHGIVAVCVTHHSRLSVTYPAVHTFGATEYPCRVWADETSAKCRA